MWHRVVRTQRYFKGSNRSSIAEPPYVIMHILKKKHPTFCFIHCFFLPGSAVYATTICGAAVQMQTNSGGNISKLFLTKNQMLISQVEPLFKMWKESDLATTKSRVAAIVKIWAKKREL